jgi:hypothetical protein
MNKIKRSSSVFVLLLGVILADTAHADRRSGYMYQDDRNARGYYSPRPEPVMPTRPFFVQPYPRSHIWHDGGRQAYRHGYRDGYRDGYSGDDYGDHRRHGDHRDRRYHDHGHRDRGFSRGGAHRDYGRYEERGSGYRHHQGSPYYYSRPGISLHYQTR